MSSVIFAFLFVLLSVISCATIKTEGIKSSVGTDLDQTELPAYPQFNGEQYRVQVMQFKIPPDISQQYPHLAEKQVGLGLSGRLVDELYETNRFKFIEEKSEIQAKILEQWSLSQSGIVIENQQITSEGISAPQFLIYAELIDFSVSHSEEIRGISLEKRATTRISIQLRFLNISTGEYTPASGTAEATAMATSLWVNPELPFDKSTVGLATQRAVRFAVLQLLQRLH
ncbi:MAG: hypothetical protein GX640_07170 [Fibrobacter sp.]|nr:hypothetical protein [Fibrobacter sp.]